MVEVEYRPCLIPSNCWELIREFMQGFMGAHVNAAMPAYFASASAVVPQQSKQNDIYQPIDTVQQYLEHFSNYRKLNSQPMGGGSTGAAAGGTGMGVGVGGGMGMRG